MSRENKKKLTIKLPSGEKRQLRMNSKSLKLLKMKSDTLNEAKKILSREYEDKITRRNAIKLFFKRKYVDSDVLRLFMNDEDHFVRFEAASHVNVSHEMLREMLTMPQDTQIIVAVASHDDLPEDLFSEVIYSNNVLAYIELLNVMKDKEIPKGALLFMTYREEKPPADYHSTIRMKKMLASRKELSEDAIKRLARDAHWEVREKIAVRNDLPEDVREALQDDEHKTVRMKALLIKDKKSVADHE